MRSIVTDSDVKKAQKAGEETQPKGDDFLTQVAKSVPAEVLAFYIPMLGSLTIMEKGNEALVQNASWIIFFLGFFATIGYAYVKFCQEETYGLALKTIVTTVAFFAWSLMMGGYTKYIPGFNLLYPTIFLGAYTLITPLIFKAYDIKTNPDKPTVKVAPAASIVSKTKPPK